MQTEIPAEFEGFVQTLVRRRRFLSAEDVLAEGLRLLHARETLVREVRAGFDEIERGEIADGPQAVAALREQLLQGDNLG